MPTPDASVVRRRRPDRIDANASGGSHAAPEGLSPLDGLWIAVALVAALLAGLVVRRHRQRPGATPAGAEAPRMMVLVGSSGDAMHTGGLDRQSRRADVGTAVLDRQDRLAA
jgi:hypothetical protein